MKLNRFTVTADLDYSPHSIDSFINMCEGLISYVTGDPSARFFLKNAVDEFTLNSIEHGYGKKPGEITVSVESIQDKIYLEISDRGVGVDPSKVRMDREAKSEEDLVSRGWALSILNRISDGVRIKPNEPKGAIVSLSISVPLR
jgi:two-component sensor histidine kinase